MRRSEALARALIVAGTALAVGLPLLLWRGTPLIRARMADSGGWNPEVIQAQAGEPLHLRFTSEDVVHGFAVGQMDMQAVDIEPGKVTQVTLTFDKPGAYTFYCTRWCGVNHWRMRGTIEVSGAEPASEPPAQAPLYVTLGIDIDADHPAKVVPQGRPSASAGEQLTSQVDLSAFTRPDLYRANSPHQVFEALASTGLTEPQRWEAVAYLWRANTSPEALAEGARLYAQNCAACHGEDGRGGGVFADDLAAAGEASMQGMEGSMEMAMQAPADLGDPGRILGASPALLEGKILRGGMGTGMPMWGSIFTPRQIENLIAYIYSFQFEYQP